MRTLAISNYKGDLGKTTTAVNLATIYAERGQRVLLIDLDPQASATDFFGFYERAEAERRTSVELLYGDASVADMAFETGTDGLSVIPSVIDLIDQNELLLQEQRLKFALDDAAGDFDTCIIDCSPVMKRLAFNAYLAAFGNGMIVIPVKLDGSVMRGTALTVSATRAIADALRMPTPKFRILRTCIPRRETRSEATGAQVLDIFFPDARLSRSRKNLAGYAASVDATIEKADLETLGEIAGIVQELQERMTSDADSSAEGVRRQS